MENKKIHIQIGLLKHEAGWEILLEQIGVPWCVLETIAQITPAAFSLVIVNKQSTESEENILQHYASTGGALLVTPSGKILNAQKKYITSLPPRSTDAYFYDDVLDVQGTCFYFPNNDIVTYLRSGKGVTASLGIDVERFMTETKIIRKNFYLPSKRLPNERVASRSKHTLRQLVISLIEFLHHVRNIPFIHKWYFPNDAPTIFTFRIDTDKGTQEEIEELFVVSEKYGIPTTWFLDVKSHKEWLGFFQKFLRQEIAVHCFEHTIFGSELLNKENFEKALSLLREFHYHPEGISAPTGAWSTTIGKAIAQLGFTYSSEFGYDHSNLPSYPVLDGAFSPVLQIPVHPVCIGSLLRAGATTEEMMNYFLAVVNKNILNREPICLYQHPTHRHNEVFEKVFQYISEANIKRFSYAEIASWWKKRLSCTMTIALDGTTVETDVPEGFEDVWMRISTSRLKDIITQPKPVLHLDRLSFEERKKFSSTPEDIMRIRKFDIRHYIQNALDWWITTTE